MKKIYVYDAMGTVVHSVGLVKTDSTTDYGREQAYQYMEDMGLDVDSCQVLSEQDVKNLKDSLESVGI